VLAAAEIVPDAGMPGESLRDALAAGLGANRHLAEAAGLLREENAL